MFLYLLKKVLIYVGDGNMGKRKRLVITVDAGKWDSWSTDSSIGWCIDHSDPKVEEDW
jgi:hypothetical protein